MSDQEKKVRLEGIVHASPYDPSAQGKQFLGAMIKCSDGKEWVLDYDEQSPFHAFAGRQVAVSGEPYKLEEGQQMFSMSRNKGLEHFRVSTMRLLVVTPDALLVQVGAGQHVRGRFAQTTSETVDSTLSFVTEEGSTFLVANDPAGATAGPSVEVLAYPVQLPPSPPTPPGEYLWIIGPHSEADLWEWRRRHL